MHLNSLRTPSCFPLLEFPSGHTVWWGLQWITAFYCNILRLLKWQVKYLSPSKSLGKDWKWTELLFSCSVVCVSLWPHGMQHTRVPHPSPSPTVWSNSCPLSWWCHPTISSFMDPFSSCPQSFPGSGFFSFLFIIIMVYIFNSVYD